MFNSTQNVRLINAELSLYYPANKT